MSAVAGRAPVRAPGPERPRRNRDLSVAKEPRPARRAGAGRRSRPHIARAILGIVVLGALLSGIVVVNLAALNQRVRSDELDQRIQQVRDEQSQLQAELAERAGVGRIEGKATRELGLVPPKERTYVKLPARRSKPAPEPGAEPTP